MLFDVYLKYVNGGSTPFNLDYSNLDVKVTLKQVTTDQRSYIDEKSTLSCYENSPNGMKWLKYSNTNDGNKVIFTTTPQSVDISFLNTNSSDHCGSTTSDGGSTKIEFEANTPSNAATCAAGTCYYVKLFTVVVNAYPGEYVVLDLDPDHTKYTPFNGSLACPFANSPAISKEISSTNLSYNGFATGNIINSPSGNNGTQNADVELQMTGPVQSNGKQEFTLKLANTSSTDNITVTHVDFYVRVSRRNNTELLNNLLNYTGNIPISIVDKGQDPSNTGYRYYLLHYVINNLGTINSGTTVDLGVIKIPNPTLTNINWNAMLTTTGQLGRINTTKTKNGITSAACTDLKSTVNSSFNLTSESEICSDQGIVFDVVKEQSTSCLNDFAYNVGLRALNGNETRNITLLEFELVFDMDSDVSISGADDTNLGINCGSGQNCEGTSTSCYSISGNTFHYCFSALATVAQTIEINPFKYIQVKFAHSGNGCVKSFKITKLKIRYVGITGAVSPCVPPIYPTINQNTQSVDLNLCGPILLGNILTETNEGLSEARVSAGTPSNCASSCTGACTTATEITNNSGLYGFCSLCSTCPKYLLTPYKDDNPLNGVSTYDLVLISKHILGIEPLGSPYKMIAADANKSNSITTFDIVELRKLILGIYTAIPSNTSWRFVDKDYSFPNQSNPFDPEFPESKDCADPTELKPFDFVAIKVGDVNNTAIANGSSMKPAYRPIVNITWNGTAAKNGEVLSIPLVYTGLETLEALQLGLRFDPSQYELIGTAPGDLTGYTQSNFGLTSADKGEIRTLWFPFQNPEERIKPGTILFYLNFKVLKGGSDMAFNLVLDNNLLSNTAWHQDGREFSIAATPSSERIPADNPKSENALLVKVQPNPTSGAVSFTINAPQAMKARIVLFSTAGARVLLHDVVLSEGEQPVMLPEVMKLPAGVYTWKVYGKGTEVQGQFVKN